MRRVWEAGYLSLAAAKEDPHAVMKFLWVPSQWLGVGRTQWKKPSPFLPTGPDTDGGLS